MHSTNDPTEWTDSDGDGVGDNGDAFPNDPDRDVRTPMVTAWATTPTLFPNGSRPKPSDSDGDGVGDNADAFPNDPAESADSDGDGVGDNADALPNDPDGNGWIRTATVSVTTPMPSRHDPDGDPQTLTVTVSVTMPMHSRTIRRKRLDSPTATVSVQQCRRLPG